jgi:isoleucyl-tRNA synthetase
LELEEQPGKFMIAWTTTPWTLPGNVALAIKKDADYVEIRVKNQNQENIKSKSAIFFNPKEIYIVAKDRLEALDAEYQILKTFKGEKLVNKKYKPLFKNDIKNGYRIIKADFVGTEDGTGIVHLAPAFGEDDFNAKKINNLPIILNVDEEGKFIDGEWKGERVWEANLKIIGWLKDKDLLYRKENVIHDYPHCYRCDAKLIYKSQPAWFIKVSNFKDQLIKNNKKINWYPEHLKKGRFGKGLETAPDWNVSRSRYWGTPIPIWECEKCGEVKVFGSYNELEKVSGQKIKDHHRPFIDEVSIECSKCGSNSRRISDVFDCWVESGSMPFAELHYPFENKEQFEKRFPAQFISEYIAQTRGWFYTLHVLSVGIFNKPSFINAVTTGTIAGNDGKKMSKSLGNFTDPNILINKYGADAFRFYLMQSVLMEGENLNFSDKDLETIHKGMFRMLWNSYSFFILYAKIDKFKPQKKFDVKKVQNLLDKWIISELNQVIDKFNQHMENYKLHKAARLLPRFIDDLSNWYIRRNRKRFWKSEDDRDKNQAYQTLYYVLLNLSKVMAPFTPFVAEEIYKNLTDKESVHLTNFPKAQEDLIDVELSEKMAGARAVITEALQIRAKNQIKVRQPLSELKIYGYNLEEEFLEIIKEEVNVKKIEIDSRGEEEVKLNLVISENLKIEGQAREVIRFIQQMRKKADYKVDNRIEVGMKGLEKVFKKFGSIIAKEVLAEKIENELLEESDVEQEFLIDGEEVKISLRK